MTRVSVLETTQGAPHLLDDFMLSSVARNGAFGGGFDYHLVKPIDPEHLERLVSEGGQAA